MEVSWENAGLLTFLEKTECCQAEKTSCPQQPAAGQSQPFPAASSANCYFFWPSNFIHLFLQLKSVPTGPWYTVTNRQTWSLPSQGSRIPSQNRLDWISLQGGPLSRESLSGKEKVCIHTLFRVWHWHIFLRSKITGGGKKCTSKFWQNTHRLINTSRSILPGTMQQEKWILKIRPGWLPEGTNLKEKALCGILLQAVWQTQADTAPSTGT